MSTSAEIETPPNTRRVHIFLRSTAPMTGVICTVQHRYGGEWYVSPEQERPVFGDRWGYAVDARSSEAVRVVLLGRRAEWCEVRLVASA